MKKIILTLSLSALSASIYAQCLQESCPFNDRQGWERSCVQAGGCRRDGMMRNDTRLQDQQLKAQILQAHEFNCELAQAWLQTRGPNEADTLRQLEQLHLAHQSLHRYGNTDFEPPAQRRLKERLQKLTLSPEQQSKIEAIVADMDWSATRDAMQKDFNALMDDENFDEARAKELIAHRNAMRREHQLIYLQQEYDVFQILTPEQQQAWLAMPVAPRTSQARHTARKTHHDERYSKEDRRHHERHERREHGSKHGRHGEW